MHFVFAANLTKAKQIRATDAPMPSIAELHTIPQGNWDVEVLMNRAPRGNQSWLQKYCDMFSRNYGDR